MPLITSSSRSSFLFLFSAASSVHRDYNVLHFILIALFWLSAHITCCVPSVVLRWACARQHAMYNEFIAFTAYARPSFQFNRMADKVFVISESRMADGHAGPRSRTPLKTLFKTLFMITMSVASFSSIHFFYFSFYYFLPAFFSLAPVRQTFDIVHGNCAGATLSVVRRFRCRYRSSFSVH